ncbi:MAG: type restriction enzyme protein [Pseudomonadota bacterium]|nr:type restriction enzyme protein [Pseudomonadota bacterium]
MNDLFAPPDLLHDGYTKIYDALSELREGFHRSGRLDDSNAKLDEVSKLFATYLAFKNNQITLFPSVSSTALIPELQSAFAATIALPEYHLDSGGSIFGTQPALAIRSGDESLAKNLVKLVRDCIDLAFDLRGKGRPFDILNEAFGHFVRDNFRSNVEDAQYMTPPEVVDFMADMVLHDLVIEDPAVYDQNKHWTVLDPSCGVGSFLAAIYHRARYSDWLNPNRLRLFGQDKVERMVRLATINLNLFDVDEHRITVGNSLERESSIDNLNGCVDIILTNPPFGARFNQNYVAASCGDNTPFFTSLRRSTASIDSELLFLDRNLRLLREGGRLLIVVPDGVVSAKGIAALLRQHLGRIATLRAVVELPAATFAQAGTRTKTAVLYLQKGHSKKQHSVFMGVSKDLGFQVSSRKGVQIKMPQGHNDLHAILAAYKAGCIIRENVILKVLCADPSCVLVPEMDILKGSWTPNHYSASRFESIESLSKSADFDLAPLCDLVEFCSDTRKAEAWNKGWGFISVLHILGEGFVDIGGALSYAPKTPGVPTYPGELLLSRINPRIARVCITPDLGVKTLCSSEFEIMKTRKEIDIYSLAYLLQTEIVQNQIRSLTSGTSASHNRIRTSELSQVMIPIAKPATKKAKQLIDLSKNYRETLIALAVSAKKLARIREKDHELFEI